MSNETKVFNPPPGWPKPPSGWKPPAGWSPDPSWPELPEGWELWIPAPVETVGKYTGDQLGSISGSEDAGGHKLENENLQHQHLTADVAGEFISLNDEQILQKIGIYRYHHPLENAAAYKD